MQWIGEGCGVDDLASTAHGLDSYNVADANAFARKCLQAQGALDKGKERHGLRNLAMMPASKWTIVHAAATFSEPEVLEAALEVEPFDPGSELNDPTITRTTPMHIAAVCRNTRLIKPLIAKGYSPEIRDRWGRTPLDTACLQTWSDVELAAAFGASAPAACKASGVLPLGARKPAGEKLFEYTGAGGGYASPASTMAIPPRCDLDVVEGMSTAEFQHMYVSARRPVVIRGEMKGPRWDKLRTMWSKENVGRAHPGMKLKGCPQCEGHAMDMVEKILVRASFLYPQIDGLVESGETFTVQEYLDRMLVDSAGDDGITLVNSVKPSDKDFDGVNSSLADSIVYPEVFDDENMRVTSPQWLLAPPNTGAPIHFHGNAINALVHGRKLWTFLPPQHSLYSTKHISKWINEDYPALHGAGKTLQCIQEPGDILFVPDGWAHGVVNLAESVGYALGFDLTAKKMRSFMHPHSSTSTVAGGAGGASTGGDPMSKATLAKKRIKVLRKMLKEEYNDGCDGCTEKAQYVNRILELAMAGPSDPAKDEL